MNKGKLLFQISQKTHTSYFKARKKHLIRVHGLVGSITFLICWFVFSISEYYSGFALLGNDNLIYVDAFLLSLLGIFIMYSIALLLYWLEKFPPMRFYEKGFDFPDDSLMSTFKRVRNRMFFIEYNDIVAIFVSKKSGKEMYDPIFETALVIITNRPYTKNKIRIFEVLNAFKDETLEFLKKAMGEKRFKAVFENDKHGNEIPLNIRRELGYD